MLEIRNLCKTYKSKGGVSVKALDGVNLSLGENGMIFILGKSGSGKSTLLNVLGGLDRPDSGEIIIRGKSSADFTQSDFDSYRNTFIGFIFQEYNILDEFTVGANIALAMELQGKKATPEALGRILEQVDLTGYAGRKPNTLSGGQKQRVAIARALIKQPEIIMADEPTGALDSNTGKQVLDTLKKLSQEKLVIVVSHDRDFAEKYADRIIELADGKVISDTTKTKVPPQAVSEGVSIAGGSVICVKKGYVLTDSDTEMIRKYISENSASDTYITLDGKVNGELKQAAMIAGDGTREVFADTGDTETKKYDPSLFKLIRSKLPFRSSFRIGASGLKHKKFRLVMTILLSTVAFTLFGLASTMAGYSKRDAALSSMKDTGVDYITISVSEIPEGNKYASEAMISDSDLSLLYEKLGVKFNPVIKSNMYGDTLPGIGDTNKLVGQDYYGFNYGGITVLNDSFGYDVTGSLPKADDEVLITRYLFEEYKLCGISDGKGEPTAINTENDIIGKTVDVSLNGISFTLKITGIADTHFDSTRYERLKKSNGALKKETSEGEEDLASQIGYFVLKREFEQITDYSQHMVYFASPACFDKLEAIYDNTYPMYGNNYNINFEGIWSQSFSGDASGAEYFDPSQTKLGENDILVSPEAALSLLDKLGMSDGSPSDLAGKEYDFLMYRLGNTGDFNVKLRVVGISGSSNVNVIAGTALERLKKAAGDGKYASAIAPMSIVPADKAVDFCYDSENDTRIYSLNNQVSYILKNINDFIETASSVFVWVGLGFALFSSLMLANFIATSISYKKREIGILRAVGARGTDVFGIFFNEALLIALINWMLSVLLTGVLSTVLNNVIRADYGLIITIMNYSVLQIALMLAISVFVAFVASFLPVWRAARKRPIDAIRSE